MIEQHIDFGHHLAFYFLTMLQIQICVPNSSVGAIIGAGGSNIKQIIRDSNAFVTIEPKRDDDPNPAAERTVTIKGSLDAQWRVRKL